MKNFTVDVISPEIRAKIQRSLETSRAIKKRDLRCPYDGFRVGTVFEDAAGHIMFKCQKCKSETVFNFTPYTDKDFRIAPK